jgi:hypothetical protein
MSYRLLGVVVGSPLPATIFKFWFDLIWFIVFNATFSNISIYWRPVLVVEEAVLVIGLYELLGNPTHWATRALQLFKILTNVYVCKRLKMHKIPLKRNYIYIYNNHNNEVYTICWQYICKM